MENTQNCKQSRDFFKVPILLLGLCFVFQLQVFGQSPPVVEDQSFLIEENTAAGAFVGQVAATLSGAGEAVFEITGGDAAHVFLINELTGDLTVNAGQLLDYESSPTLTLNVRVSQGAEFDEAIITVNLVDIQLPVVASGDAAGITTSGATIPGYLTNALSGSFVAVQLSLTESLNDTFDPETDGTVQYLSPGDENANLQFQLSGLVDGVEYFYRIAAKNSEGTVFGDLKSFTTLSIPRVESIVIRDANPTNSETVTFLVTFSEAVNGLDLGDFELELEDVDGGSPLTAALASIDFFNPAESQLVYLVTIDNISGDGTIKLNFRDDNSVESVEGVKAGGDAIGDGDFTNGEMYTIDNTHPSIFTLLYTNEDASVVYSFAVSDAPHNPQDLIVEFNSDSPLLIPNTNYEVTGENNVRKIRIFPAPHRHGSAFITIKVKDGAGNVSPTPININVIVRAVADAPLLYAEDVTGLEDHEISLDVAASLQDQDGSEVFKTLRISGVPEGGSLSAGTTSGNGVYNFTDPNQLEHLTFTPKQDDFGSYTFTLLATAQEQETNTDLYTVKERTVSKEFTVNVLPVNDAPAFELSTYKVEKDEDFEETVTIILTDLSPANEPEPIVYRLDPTSVDFANISIDENSGNITITAKKDAFGAGFVKVIADDGQAEHNLFEDQFELIIHSINDLPVFTLSPESLELEEDFTETHYVEIIPGEVPQNEISQLVEYSISVKDGEDPIASVLIVEKDGKQQLEIKAIADANGTQVFVITAEEDIDPSEPNRIYERELELIINPVNDLPAFVVAPAELTLDEDFEEPQFALVTPLAVPYEEDQVVTYTVAVKGGDEPIATVEVIESEGLTKLKVSSIKHENGEQVYEITADDGIDTYSQDFALTINPVNDAPAFELSTYKVERDEDFEETVTIFLTDLSPANEPEPIVYSLDPSSVDFANISIDENSGDITITAKKDAFGAGFVKVIADDGQAEHNLFEAQFELVIHSVNDAPVFTLAPESLELEEDFTETHYVEIIPGAVPQNEISQLVAYSVSVKNSEDPIANVQIVEKDGKQQLEITAIADANGTQIFVVIAEEDIDPSEPNRTYAREFKLIITPVNELPRFVLVPDRLTLDEDFDGPEWALITPLPVPQDEEDQVVSYSVAVKNGGAPIANLEVVEAEGLIKLKISSIENANGEQVFEVTANNGNDTYKQDFTLTVNAVNDAPTFSISPNHIEKNEDFIETVVVTFTDLSPANENEAISYSISPNSVDFVNVSYDELNGRVLITSSPDLFGSEVFTITAEDAFGATFVQTLTLIVHPVNDPPVFTLSPTYIEKDEDFEGTATVEVVSTSSPANEIETITYSLSPASVSFAHISIDPPSGKVSITAKKDAFGEGVIKVVANDGQAVNNLYEQSFTLRVNPVDNDAPVLVRPIDNLTAYEDQLFQYSILIGETAFFQDPDGNETLNFSASLIDGGALPLWLTFNPATRIFSGTPAGTDVGVSNILIRATDPDGQWVEGDFILTVVAVNDAPEISSIDDVSVKLGSTTPAEVSFSVWDEDNPAGDLLISLSSENPDLIPVSAIEVKKSGENGEVRTLTFYPPGLETLGSSVITVTVSDGELEVQETFTFTVEYSQLALDIPNLITPNYDNKNDTWNIRYLSLYETNEVMVYDSNGRLVFKSRNYSTSSEWDGTQDGREVPEGIYLYEIRLNGGAMVKRGTLTIAR